MATLRDPATSLARPRRRACATRGDSLVEVVVATLLIGTAFVAIVQALSSLTTSAVRHNETVLLESALTQAKQSLASQTFSPIPAATCAPVYALPAVGGVTFEQCVTPRADPLPLQEIAIRARGPTSARSGIFYKGAR